MACGVERLDGCLLSGLEHFCQAGQLCTAAGEKDAVDGGGVFVQEARARDFVVDVLKESAEALFDDADVRLETLWGGYRIEWGCVFLL